MSFHKDRTKNKSKSKRQKEKRKNDKKRLLKHQYKSKKKSQREHEQINRARKKVIKKYKKCFPPINFSFLDNPNEVSKFINNLANLYSNNKSVYIELSELIHIDYSAIAVLISIMASFREKGIAFEGSFPKNENCRNILLSAGFFRELVRKNRTRAFYYQGVKNQLLTQAETKVIPELGLMASEDVSETIWGEKRVVIGLHRVLLELMQNTNNHAGKDQGDKHWWLSINHRTEERTVSFVFVDYGVGIFNSLATKPADSKWSEWIDKVASLINFKDNIDVMKMMLSGEFHMSVTGKSFRGKGIPGIKQAYDRGQIKNLKFISNDVYVDCATDHFERLMQPFDGTFVFWDVDSSCSSKDWIGYDNN